jgi:hypothetical protein
MDRLEYLLTTDIQPSSSLDGYYSMSRFNAPEVLNQLGLKAGEVNCALILMEVQGELGCAWPGANGLFNALSIPSRIAKNPTPLSDMRVWIEQSKGHGRSTPKAIVYEAQEELFRAYARTLGYEPHRLPGKFVNTSSNGATRD